MALRPWEIDRRSNVRKSTTRTPTRSTTYRPPTPAAAEQRRSGGTAGRSTMGKGPITTLGGQTYDATGSRAAYDKYGADDAFGRVEQYNMDRWARGVYPNQQSIMGQQGATTDTGGGGGGGWGGGGGGGGGGLDPAEFDAYAAQMIAAIKGITPIDSPLAGLYGGAVDKDIAEARGAYAGIADRISTADPFLSMVAQAAPTVRPEMEAFLRGQGVDTGQYGSAVDAQNAELRAGADNWSNYAKAMGKNHVAGQRNMIDTSRMQGENVVQGFEGQRTELGAIVAAQQAAEQKRVQQERQAAIMQLLATGLQYGRAPDISGLMGGR